jgi:hypothetical protein
MFLGGYFSTNSKTTKIAVTKSKDSNNNNNNNKITTTATKVALLLTKARRQVEGGGRGEGLSDFSTLTYFDDEALIPLRK